MFCSVRRNPSYLFSIIPEGCITSHIGDQKVARARTNIGKILGPALVFLLLCGIVGGEFPELLTLTDNTANDFTFGRTKTVVLRVSLDASRHARIADVVSNTPAPGSPFWHLLPSEKATMVPSELSILHSVLRT
jgi:hypothetical protein